MLRRYRSDILLLSFFLGGSFGGLWETLWTFFRWGSLEWKSGIMFFPLCNPIYGIGALLITCFAQRTRRFLPLYAFSVAACTAAEFFFSFAEELVLGSISWDYSSHFMNINGRVNVLYSLFWGFLAVFWVYIMLPQLLKWCDSNPDKTEALISVLLPIFILLAVFSFIGLLFDSYGSLDSPLRSVYTQPLLSFFYPSRKFV